MADSTEHLTIDAIIEAVDQSTVPPGDPDDHDMMRRLTTEIRDLRTALVLADGGLVMGLGRGLSDFYAEDAEALQVVLRAGVHPRGSDHRDQLFLTHCGREEADRRASTTPQSPLQTDDGA